MSDEITRNTPGGPDDYVGEMVRRERSEQREIDALLSGRVTAGEESDDVAVLLERLRSTASTQPEPSDELAVVLAEGLSVDELAGAVAAPTDVHEPGPAARPPGWRRGKQMLEVLIAKLAALGVAAKVGLASAALVAGATGAGAAGVPVLDGLDRVTPFDLVAEQAEESEEANDHGQTVAETAQSDDLEGCEHGQAVAEAARSHDAAENADVDPAECPDDVGEGERPEHPGADGRDEARENVDENGERGLDTADDAAENGRDFGEERSDDAPRGGGDAGSQSGSDAATTGQQTGEDAATSGQERGSDARHAERP